jgi:3,4-dihydroxy 2-butanone 4-phosphate synthase / GTP cyclohydrolase II
MSYVSVEEAIEAVAAGRVLIAVDSEDRENEGDFLAAAEAITPEIIHFMITHARGHLCMPIAPDIAQRLDLAPLVPQKDLTTPCFAMPVDHKRCTTGISPVDRAETVRAMVESSTRPSDFLRPGHIFPLIAQDSGVLGRQGHTEAAVELAQMAGLAPAGVLCEICSHDGRHMADGWELQAIAEEFRLPMITIDALVDFRRSAVGREEKNLSPVKCGVVS